MFNRDIIYLSYSFQTDIINLRQATVLDSDIVTWVRIIFTHETGNLKLRRLLLCRHMVRIYASYFLRCSLCANQFLSHTTVLFCTISKRKFSKHKKIIIFKIKNKKIKLHHVWQNRTLFFFISIFFR